MKQKIVDHDIIQLCNNYIPKELVPLEKLFDENDVSRFLISNSQQENIQDCNIGTTKEVRNIKILATLPQDIRDKYIKLFKEYKDIFAWSYEDLKTCDTTILEYKIPLKP